MFVFSSAVLFFSSSVAQTMHDSNGVAMSWSTLVSPLASFSFRGYDVVATLSTFSTSRQALVRRTFLSDCRLPCIDHAVMKGVDAKGIFANDSVWLIVSLYVCLSAEHNPAEIASRNSGQRLYLTSFLPRKHPTILGSARLPFCFFLHNVFVAQYCTKQSQTAR